MEYTWKKRTLIAIRSLLDEDDMTRANVVKRALYFNKYRIAVHLSATPQSWPDFSDIVRDLEHALVGLDCKLVSVLPAMYTNLYCSDPKILDEITNMEHLLDIHSIDVVRPECWGLSPKPRNKGKFYHQYGYRIKIDGMGWDHPFRDLMVGTWYQHGSFLYCTDSRDVVMIRLLYGGKIQQITERQL
jgi:hypothetical protein